MKDAIASRVYPVVVQVLRMKDRISRGVEVPADESHARLEQLLRLIAPPGTSDSATLLVQAALVYWIDEVLVNCRWDQAQQWQDKTLERTFYNTRRRASDFFEKANQAASLPETDALEVFLLCAALGFRGVYRNQAAEAAAAKSLRNSPPPPTAAGGKSAVPMAADWFESQGGSKESAAGSPAAAAGDDDDWQSLLQTPAKSAAEGQATKPGSATAPPATADAPEDAWAKAFGGSSGPSSGSGSALRAPRPAMVSGGIELPPTLSEWAESVAVRCRSGRSGNRYRPAGPAELQRDAGPLDSDRAMSRSMILLMAASLWSVVAVIGYHVLS